MSSVGWLRDASEESLRSALAVGVPELAPLPLRINPRPAQSNPLYWSTSAVVDERFVVKYAWSEVRAVRLWHEGVVLARLRTLGAALPIPELVALTKVPALVVTRLIAGAPLSWEWANRLTVAATEQVAQQLAAFLVRLHDVEVADVVADLPVVHPTPQADTARLRADFPRLVDEHRRASVAQMV